MKLHNEKLHIFIRRQILLEWSTQVVALIRLK
jgi:hypothetical protein